MRVYAFAFQGFDEHCNGDAADRVLLESLDEESRQELLLERFEARQRMMEYHEVWDDPSVLACFMCICTQEFDFKYR